MGSLLAVTAVGRWLLDRDVILLLTFAQTVSPTSSDLRVDPFESETALIPNNRNGAHHRFSGTEGQAISVAYRANGANWANLGY